MTSSNVIELKNVHYRYDRDYVLTNINLTVPKGAFLGIVGPNGSGKSTMLKIILGLLKPRQGTVILFGEPQAKFRDRERIGYVSQKANAFNTGFPATVYEVVASGLTKKAGLFKMIGRKRKPQIEKAIKAVGMEDFMNRNIGELSGGQQQRVFIARAIVSEPDVLILDEPTVGVDSKNVQTFYDMLERLNKQLSITLLLVTHDIGTITSKVTHVACLNNSIHFHGSTKDFEQVKDNELSQFYGHEVHRLHHDHGHHHHTEEGTSL
ncbi:metal ABC transporter ATP-binding protein [Jeotgalibacillus proteolyticus]|uniref:Zinc ABC transporter ATP-binding protein n=1 Tax=Jeotgalibacillus proteolyticus TaxID=2082395 RepID=A0A2S5GEH1_9BACL|nr:metal ABC transporter ATP-binding protein [Jeotgalibacillus proteolyticus]PPA71430.1 zinc ABC transporter ATP-binding protein [Jeotgalibacillus proteolyticus]